MAAWRPNRSVIEGELDNTTPGRVTGRMSFVGLPGPVTFDLRGDFHRDIRGAKIRFENTDRPEPTEEVRQYMEGFATHQTGVAGDMTAGLPPQDYVDYPYLEWYSDQNGRVVLEFEPEQVQVIGTPLDWRKEQPVSREAQGRNMGKFLSEVAASFSPRPEAGHPEGPPAAEKEGAEADFRVRNYGTLWEFNAATERARALSRDDLGLERWQWIHEGCFALDHRPAGELIERLREDGFRFAGPALEQAAGKEATTPAGGHECTAEAEPKQGSSAEEHLARRIGQAETVLSCYHDRDQEANLTDCLADLMHLCKERGISFKDALHEAHMHYTAERAELREEHGLSDEKAKERDHGPER